MSHNISFLDKENKVSEVFMADRNNFKKVSFSERQSFIIKACYDVVKHGNYNELLWIWRHTARSLQPSFARFVTNLTGEMVELYHDDVSRGQINYTFNKTIAKLLMTGDNIYVTPFGKISQLNWWEC